MPLQTKPKKKILSLSPCVCCSGLSDAGPQFTLVLDLDETLVHCSVEPISCPDYVFPVVFNDVEYQVSSFSMSMYVYCLYE